MNGGGEAKEDAAEKRRRRPSSSSSCCSSSASTAQHQRFTKGFYIELAAFSDSIYERGEEKKKPSEFG